MVGEVAAQQFLDEEEVVDQDVAGVVGHPIEMERGDESWEIPSNHVEHVP